MNALGTRTMPRVLLAVGDRALEGRLVQELPEQGIEVVGRCLDAAGLLGDAKPGAVDAVVVSPSLHRLTDATLLALRERGVPVVLLAADERELARYTPTLADALPRQAPAATIAMSIRQAVQREGSGAGRPVQRSRAAAGSAATGIPAGSGSVIAVASGKGAPGKTTLSIALAAGLAGPDRNVVLVDADLRGGNVAPALDLDPRLGLVGLASSKGPFEQRLEAELQPGPGITVLAGIERPELAAAVDADTLRAAIAALRQRFTHVVVDLGVPAESAVLAVADEVLVVTGADLVSVWNARNALPALRAAAPHGWLTAVVNRHEGREVYDQGEIERVLGVPVLGVLREDREAARRALSRQEPLAATGGGVGRDLRAWLAALAGAHVSGAAAGHAAGAPARLVMEG